MGFATIWSKSTACLRVVPTRTGLISTPAAFVNSLATASVSWVLPILFLRTRYVTPQILEEIEHRLVTWRWRLKGLAHRLRVVHGDFHPWNILFEPAGNLPVLDRSRGEFGEAADDVACLTINYLFFSLRRNGRLEGGFEDLFRRFWRRYLERSADSEILKVVAPFYAFRGLVLANPVWYPNLCDGVRTKILSFTLAVLDAAEFDPAGVNGYCGA